MAWTDLKAAVAAVIKTNGTQSITGALLQSTLNSIIDQVGANSAFKGIATPSTVPGTPDGPVFYIAAQAGTYTNFGGIVVNDGEAAIFKYVNSSWVKEVSGLATREEVSQLGQYIENPEWVQVVTDSEGKILYGVKKDGKFYFGDGCPPQVQSKLGALTNLLNAKVNKVTGKSLIDSEFASSQEVITNPEYLQVITDSDGKILEGIKTNGKKVQCTDVEYPNGIPESIKEYVDEQSSKIPMSQISAEAYNQLTIDRCNNLMEFPFNTCTVKKGKVTLRHPISEYIAKIAVFGDLHVGLGYSQTVKWNNWENCIEQSLKWGADKCPYFGLGMGDQLSSMNSDINNKGIRELNDYYNRIRPFNYPFFPMSGNHDDAVPEFIHNGVIEIANVRIICFCATLGYISYEDPDLSLDPVGNVTDDTFNWLEQEVIKSYNGGYITILACHYCLYKTPGHYEQYWNGYIHDHRDDIIQLCSDYNVRLFINGHNHHGGLKHVIVVDANNNPLDMTNVEFGMGGRVYSEFIIKNDGFYFIEHEVCTLDNIDNERYYAISDDHVTHTLFVPMTNQASGTIYE